MIDQPSTALMKRSHDKSFFILHRGMKDDNPWLFTDNPMYESKPVKVLQIMYIDQSDCLLVELVYISELEPTTGEVNPSEQPEPTMPIPMQLCPKCKGEGFLIKGSLTRDPFSFCDVCKGKKTIPMYVIRKGDSKP